MPARPITKTKMKKPKRSRPNKKTARRRPASNKTALAIIAPHATVPFGTFGTFTATGWTPPKHLTYARWQAIGRRLFHDIDTGVQWCIADFWAYGEHAYGDRIQLLKDGFFGEYVYCTVATYASVARAIEVRRRVEGLSCYVAPLPPEEQDKWLARAARKHWSSDDLYFAIHPDRRGRRIESPSADASDAANIIDAAISADVRENPADSAGKSRTGSAAAVHQHDRPAPEMADEAQWRFNLNQGGNYLRYIPRTPLTPYLHPAIHYTADEWDEIADFLKTLATAMRNTVAALDETAK
jgi:hypothetical protein